ncbi:hypothetical protein [Paenibacillus cremeus]|uniref:Uncharacterized protein n=1 Tax=Paenibacillus cremeus TaxID=2163881 RepID=A0A559JDF7_9BACL|nr:hypothetical protein [Paenibacillus cremeus]TVX97905.1 hypothetical protein FPZ49_34790 [Paenibacillus cremeus]
MVELIQRYVKAKRGTDVTVKALRAYPYHQIIGWWWDAQAYFMQGKMYYELPPTDGYVNAKTVYLRIKKGEYMQYMCWDGNWLIVGELLETTFKD